MTPEQQALFDQLTALQQRTATGVLAGMSQRAAYFAAGGTAKSDESADSTVATMLSNVKVKAFMDSMKAQAVSDAVMTRQEMLEELSMLGRYKLTDIVKFQTATVGMDMETGDPLQQTAWHIPEDVPEDRLAIIESLEAGGSGLKIKTYSRIQAMTLLAKLQGFEAPAKVENTHRIVDSDEGAW
jgi:phage terminase small subunit